MATPAAAPMMGQGGLSEPPLATGGGVAVGVEVKVRTIAGVPVGDGVVRAGGGVGKTVGGASGQGESTATQASAAGPSK